MWPLKIRSFNQILQNPSLFQILEQILKLNYYVSLKQYPIDKFTK